MSVITERTPAAPTAPPISGSIRSTERVHKATGASLFWRGMWARAYPRLIGTQRDVGWLVSETLLPLLATFAYVYVYIATGAPQEYIGFAVMGGTATAFWLNILWSMASQLYWDKDDGNLELYVISPAPLTSILMGMAVGGFVMAATRGFSILIIGSLLFSVSYEIANLPLLLAVFFFTMAALYGMGMMMASIFLAAGREAWHLSNMLQEPIYLASGMYFPVKALGALAATVSSALPLTLGIDAIRQLIFDNQTDIGWLPPETSLLLLIGLSVLFIAGAHFSLKWLEMIGRREGRLIERRK
ncbi:MAG: ABC transporter permease [bacterium]|nr:ABC transporter permease [bacterium]